MATTRRSTSIRYNNPRLTRRLSVTLDCRLDAKRLRPAASFLQPKCAATRLIITFSKVTGLRQKERRPASVATLFDVLRRSASVRADGLGHTRKTAGRRTRCARFSKEGYCIQRYYTGVGRFRSA